MTETGPEPPLHPASPEDHAYFQAVEEAFLRLRGKATLLSPADWQVAQGWQRAGVPLELVLRVMEELFARAKERRRRTLSSLRYFKAAVEAAWEEVAALSAGGRRERLEPFGMEDRLRRLAEALDPTEPVCAAAREAILALAGGVGGEIESVEGALTAIDRDLVTRLSAKLGASETAEIENAVDEATRNLAGRLPGAELERARDHLRHRLLRQRHHLPVLSLFAPEARGPASADES